MTAAQTARVAFWPIFNPKQHPQRMSSRDAAARMSRLRCQYEPISIARDVFTQPLSSCAFLPSTADYSDKSRPPRSRFVFPALLSACDLHGRRRKDSVASGHRRLCSVVQLATPDGKGLPSPAKYCAPFRNKKNQRASGTAGVWFMTLQSTPQQGFL